MAKVKVTTRFAIHEFIDRVFSDHLVNTLGKKIVALMKDEIAEGLSPVAGVGRFERYKDRKKYPGAIKPARPVNLNLTGEMLEGLGFKKLNQKTIEVGMTKGSAERKAIAGHHQTGTEHMAARPFIPQDGDFSIRVMRAIREIYGKALSDAIRKGNAKD